VEVYTKVKSPPVENFAHGWKNDMAANVATLFWRGVLRRSSFLGNLKASDKKLGHQRTLTWIKYYPSMCCFQHFKVIFEGLGLVFKHFHMLQRIVSCSVLMTCLIPKGPLFAIGIIGSHNVNFIMIFWNFFWKWGNVQPAFCEYYFLFFPIGPSRKESCCL
jgi:hypothetical protein